MLSEKDAYLASVKKKFDELNCPWTIERNKFAAKRPHERAHARKKREQERVDLRKLRKEVREPPCMHTP